MAINFVKNDDIRILRDIEQFYSTQIDEMPMNGESAFVLQPLTSSVMAALKPLCCSCQQIINGAVLSYLLSSTSVCGSFKERVSVCRF